MKKLFGHLILIIVLASCSENFDSIDPTIFNTKIANRTNIETAEELVELFYNYPKNEGKLKATIKSRKLKGQLIEVTLVHDGQEDDSQRATKIIMTAQLKYGIWIVHEIRTNRKCYDGRGHTGWGTEWCN